MESLIWMFRKKDFIKHFGYLIILSIVLTILSIVGIIALSMSSCSLTCNKLIFQSLLVILAILPSLLSLGYFWELTENIIDRQIDISANNIYDGKVKKCYNIEFPELKLGKFLWRGFASIIANIIMVIPYLSLIFISIYSGNSCHVPMQIYVISLIIYVLLIPGLLWNYAKQNSVVAVLNISKAVYLMGNYTFRYFCAILFYILICVVNAFFDKYLVNLIMPHVQDFQGWQNIAILIFLLGYMFFVILKSFYMLFVYSYILGTLVPPEEC